MEDAMVVRGRVLVAVVTVAAVLTAGAASSAVAAAGPAQHGVVTHAGGSVPDGAVLAYRRTRVTVEQHAVEQRDGAVIRDISYSAGGGPAVRAYVVEPDGPARPHARAGVLYLHWFHPGDPTSSRLEFVEEAVGLAGRGTVSLLPDLTFPWNGDPVGDATDLRVIVDQTIQVRRGLDLLQDRRDVDSRRIAVVGHDYGGMYGLLVAAVDRHRVRTAIAVNVDATFCNWFLQFWLGFEGDAATAYQRLLEPVDPIRYVPFGPRGGTLFQFSVPDFFIPDSTARTLFAAASHPKDQRLYPGAPHKLDAPEARADRVAWLAPRLSLPGS
jgi:pimeloyl-ACP methyl ester carboxylesterase